MNERIRVQLKFAASPPQCSDLGNCFMLLIDKRNCSTVRDVKKIICKRFGFKKTRRFTLHVNDYALIPQEDVDVIRDGDELQVTSSKRQKLDVIKPSLLESKNGDDVKEASAAIGLSCPEKNTSNDCVKSVESEPALVHGFKNTTDQNFKSNSADQIRKHKKQKSKKQKCVDVKVEQDEIASARKSKKKKGENSYNKDESEAFCGNKTSSNAALNIEVSEGVRKAKKKKTSRSINNADDGIDKNKSSSSNTVQDRDVSVEVKEKRKTKSKKLSRKKDVRQCTSRDNVTKQKHEDVICSDNELTEVDPPGVNNHNQNVTYQQQHNDSPDDVSNLKKWLSGEKNTESTNYMDIEPPNDDPIDYSKLPFLHWPPRIGDTIAFKIMHLAEDYTPYVTDYIKGTVKGLTGTDPASAILDLEIESGFNLERHSDGRFEMDFEEEDSSVNLNNETTSFAWNTLIEPKLLL